MVDFGAFVNFIGNRDGLVHISALADHRVGKVTDVVKEGDQVKVKVLGIDDRGKVRLSLRVVDQETSEDLTGAAEDAGSAEGIESQRPRSSERGRRSRRRAS